MTKEELVNLFNSLEIEANEGITSDRNKNIYPRIIFWDYIWESIVASNTEYNTLVTYQISFLASNPRNEKLLELKRKLNEKSIYPIIQHEYVETDKCFHSYFSIDVLENV